MLQICLAGSAVAALLLNVHWAFAGIVVTAAIHSAFLVGPGPNIDALALAHLGEEHMSDYGRIRGWESLTYAAGCLCFGLVLERFGMGWAMPIFAVSAVLVLAWSTTVDRDRPTELEDHGRMGAVGAGSARRRASGGSWRRRSSSGSVSTRRGTSSRCGSRTTAAVRC